MAFSPDGKLLATACQDGTARLWETATYLPAESHLNHGDSVPAVAFSPDGKVVATAPIGAGVDGVGFDPAFATVFASNADGTLTVIQQDSPDQYRVVQTVQTPPASRNMGLDPTNHRLFVAAAMFGPAPAGGRGRGPVLQGSFQLLVIGRLT